MKKIILFLFLSVLLTYCIPVYSQTDSTTEEPSIEEQLEEILASLSSLQKTLKEEKRKRPIARTIKSITRRIIRAVNTVPPDRCLTLLKVAMDDFYELVSDLGSAIACGPPILPPFLPGEETEIEDDLDINCIPPPEDNEVIVRLQIGGPFGGAFSDVHPVYNDCRGFFQIDTNGNNISDVCE